MTKVYSIWTARQSHKCNSSIVPSKPERVQACEVAKASAYCRLGCTPQAKVGGMMLVRFVLI